MFLISFLNLFRGLGSLGCPQITTHAELIFLMVVAWINDAVADNIFFFILLFIITVPFFYYHSIIMITEENNLLISYLNNQNYRSEWRGFVITFERGILSLLIENLYNTSETKSNTNSYWLNYQKLQWRGCTGYKKTWGCDQSWR